jgi:hypothetical protein
MRQQPFASKPLHEQVEEAFSKATELSWVIHGVRTIHQGTPGRRTGLFPSVKNDAVMATESKLETAHCLDLERMSSLDAYRLQALAVRTSVTSTQYPDALLRWSDGSLGAKEVKPSPQHLTSPKQQAFDRVAAALEIAFITYNVVYAAQLPSGMELWNLKWLYARGNHKNWSNHELEAATRLWKANTSSLTLGELWRQLGAASLDPLIAEYLIFHRVIPADLHKMLGPDSSLSEVSSA